MTEELLELLLMNASSRELCLIQRRIEAMSGHVDSSVPQDFFSPKEITRSVAFLKRAANFRWFKVYRVFTGGARAMMLSCAADTLSHRS